jgi:transposase-like protein
VRVPVWVALGVRAAGQRVLLDLRLAGPETTAAWEELITGLVQRRVGVPLLALIAGNPGLQAARRAQWPQLASQRGTAHQLRTLLAKAPAPRREELAED